MYFRVQAQQLKPDCVFLCPLGWRTILSGVCCAYLSLLCSVCVRSVELLGLFQALYCSYLCVLVSLQVAGVLFFPWVFLLPRNGVRVFEGGANVMCRAPAQLAGASAMPHATSSQDDARLCKFLHWPRQGNRSADACRLQISRCVEPIFVVNAHICAAYLCE